MAEAKEEKKKDGGNSAMLKIATFIVDRRNLFFLLIGIALVFCGIAQKWVKVENDLAAYLPDSAETSRGLDLMNDQFITYGSAKIMVANITYDEACDIREDLKERSDVTMVSFGDDTGHYNNFSALYEITFAYPETDEKCLKGLDEIKEMLSGYDIYVSTSMGDQAAEIIAQEMKVVSALVVVVVLSVLIFTSSTYAEVPVLLLTFGASAVLASGTNFFLGTISFVSDSVTIVLQLALSVDYAIIFCNRYKEEHRALDIREADIVALSKAIPEICSSSLTTVGGLIAMMFMQYGIGKDMAICLIKAIFFSLLSVFLLMPGLIMVFGKAMDKTRHKSFIPRISFVGRFDYLTRFIVPPVFVLLVVGAFFMSGKCPYVYGYSKIVTPVLNENQIAEQRISDAFGESNFVALMVPSGSYDKEAALMKELESMPEVDRCQGLANTEAMDGYMLTDSLSAREFSELFNVDYEVSELLYMAYAINDENYAKIINGFSGYKIPLIDIVMFLYEEVEEGYVTLDDDLLDTLRDANAQMQMARDQLQGEDYSRMLVYLNLPQEGDETFAFLDELHEIAGKYYDGPEKILVAGESTSQYDLMKTFARDNTVVSVVSILAVLAVLLFTFLSAGMPVLLILVIQGAIWINFSFPTIQHTYLFFMGYLIVSSIQMGANIDYAIVISGRYTELRKIMGKKEAVIETLNFAFPTIITSGSMMVLSGVAIGRLSSDATICGIGQCLGRGTLISIFLVMFVLPQILMVGEKIIERTSFEVSVPIKLDRGFGTVRVDGFVRGQINGTVVGEMHALVRGEVAAVVTMGGLREENEGEDGENRPLLGEKEE
ncbi:MAG: MMPL family transporter [Lachnospiraceae bacterium]|nr:MMPL family transporter [Lachnospiraceae bacterium]